ncbi:MAG: substrate-binding domain-containing protein, partial [Victivallaceae bacterium]|nr:substrate-binding domain-containing protein [Victivallaceae bacterium]
VVAYDGYAFSGFCAPSLTTVAQPIREQAEIGVKLLLERIATKEISSPPANHLIKPILYAGASCGCQERPINKLYNINTFDMMEKSEKMNFNTNIFNNQRSNENE